MEKDIKVIVVIQEVKLKKWVVILLIALFIGHFSALYAGLYQGKVWVDIPLHILGGIILGLLGILIGKQKHQIFFILLFSLGGSILWELFELTLWSIFPTIATTLKLYSPTFSDAASDVLSGFVGGIVVMLEIWKRKTN